jgi:hypothetical protein
MEWQYFEPSNPDEQAANHGFAWTPQEIRDLITRFYSGVRIGDLAVIHRRKRNAIALKLQGLGQIEYDGIQSRYRVKEHPMSLVSTSTAIGTMAVSTNSVPISNGGTYVTNATINTQGETKVADKNIETKVFIKGVDAANLTDSQIFDRISNLEQQIANLNKIENKPKKLTTAIKDLQKDIRDMIDYVDSRD